MFVYLFVYCCFISGQGGLLLKYWRWIGVFKDSIPDQYKVELSAVEEQGTYRMRRNFRGVLYFADFVGKFDQRKIIMLYYTLLHTKFSK